MLDESAAKVTALNTVGWCVIEKDHIRAIVEHLLEISNIGFDTDYSDSTACYIQIRGDSYELG